MTRVLKLFSQNKKTLILIAAIGLVLSLMPLQSINAQEKTITITHPNGGEVFRAGEIINFTWNYTGEIDEFVVMIWDTERNQMVTRWITTASSHQGAAADPFNKPLKPGEKYRAKVCELKGGLIALDPCTDVYDFSNSNFTIVESELLPGCAWHTPTACFLPVVNWIITLPIRIVALIIAIPLLIIALAAGLGFSIIVVILGFFKTVILNIPVMPKDVAVVQAGFDITQGLANIFLILVLVFIGLATILRIKDYEAKKLLPILIIVALLVNFSPVLVGFIVDITNIISNFFLQLGSLESFKSVWEMIWNYAQKVLFIFYSFDDIWTTIGHIIGTVVLGLILSAFFLYSSWIYLLVIVLLLVRVVILWILMILAPIAFLFYILPATRNLAMEWWKNLIQWSMLSIPIGFFLFLSFKVLEETTQVAGFLKIQTLSGEVADLDLTTGGGPAEFADQFSNITQSLAQTLGLILTPLVSIILLHIGYKMSRRHMPAAANGIINGITTGMKIIGTTALVAATGGAAAGLGIKGLAGVSGLAQKADAGLKASKLGRVPVLGKLARGFTTAPAAFVTRKTQAALSPKLLEIAAKGDKVLPENIKKMKEMPTPKEQQAYIEAMVESTPGANLPGAKNLREKHLSQYAAAMDPRDYENTDQSFRDKVGAAKDKLNDDEGYKKTVDDLRNRDPDKINKELKIEFELKEDQEEMRRRIEEMEERIKNMFSDEQIIDLTAKHFKVSLTEVTPEMKKEFIESQAAGAVHVIDMKTKDEEEKSKRSVKSLANRLGMTYGGTAGKLEKVHDLHKKSTAENVLNGPGGLNYIVENISKGKDFDQLDNTEQTKIMDILEDVQRENETYLRWFFTNPAGRKHKLAIRDMLRIKQGTKVGNDPDGRRAYEQFAATIKGEKKTPEEKIIMELNKEIEALQQRLDNLNKSKKSVKLPPEGNARREENLAKVTTDLDNKKEKLKNLQDTLKIKIDEKEKVKGLPTLDPNPSEKEIKLFRAIATGEKNIPSEGKTEKILRMARGTIREIFHLQKGVEGEIKKIEGLLKEAESRGETTNSFTSSLATLKTDLENLQRKEGELKNKESSLEEKLLNEKNEKERKKNH